MSAKNIVMAAAGAASGPTYVDDVFSTFLYTGNGTTQTITNGIDLAGKNGLVWTKSRTNGSRSHALFDTARGANQVLYSDLTNASSSEVSSLSFASNGFSLGANGAANANGENFVSWTFRKAPKFFDVVTYTGDGSTNQVVNHSLGIAPGLIIVKSTSAVAGWLVYHRSLGYTKRLVLNTTNAEQTTDSTIGFAWGTTGEPTSTTFTVGDTSGDPSSSQFGATYIAYLFAHDTAADGLIQCGSFTTDALGYASVTLGWEPQWVLIKPSSVAGNWQAYDSMRGMAVGTSQQVLYPNLTNAETATSNKINLNATGFGVENSGSTTYIYIAIRRPNKPPTSGSSVLTISTSTGLGIMKTNTGITTDATTINDAVILRPYRTATTAPSWVWADSLRGYGQSSSPYIDSSTTAAETTTTLVSKGTDNYLNFSGSTFPALSYVLRRAPGFFDVVCYTGTGSNTTQTHNLSVVPEMIIIAARNGTPVRRWSVGHKINSFAGGCELNTNGAMDNNNFTYFASTAPTASVFSLPNIVTNDSGVNYVAYLFATCPGVSKVGSYTGNGGTVNNNGTSQTINCGFSGDARFVLIKRRDSTGDWYTFDTARGIVAASDPYLLLNSTAVEVTTVDAVDPDNSGFIVNQTSGTNLNVTSATYIYLAIA